MIMSGKRNTRAEFQEQQEIKDDAGEVTQSWVTKCSAFVYVRSLGSDFQSDDATNYQVSQFEVIASYSRRLYEFMSTSKRIIINNKAYRVVQMGDSFTRKTLSYVIESYE